MKVISAASSRVGERIEADARITELQETLEEDFFTKLVKINFKYIDQYYLQTQSQADKSFVLSAVVAVFGLGVVMAGIILLFANKLATPVYVTTASGVLAEFIAAVFFYLHNRTVLKMAEYHQKLVMTQNVSLALKIAEGLDEPDKTQAQREIIQRLTDRVNEFLTRSGGTA